MPRFSGRIWFELPKLPEFPQNVWLWSTRISLGFYRFPWNEEISTTVEALVSLCLLWRTRFLPRSTLGAVQRTKANHKRVSYNGNGGRPSFYWSCHTKTYVILYNGQRQMTSESSIANVGVHCLTSDDTKIMEALGFFHPFIPQSTQL